jgi:hypothetical protein
MEGEAETARVFQSRNVSCQWGPRLRMPAATTHRMGKF